MQVRVLLSRRIHKGWCSAPDSTSGDSGAHWGYSSTGRACYDLTVWRDSEAAKTWWREYRIRRYADRKAQAMAYLGGKCVDCESTQYLEFDHIDPATKVAAIATLLLHSWEKILPELAKCTLRCKGCHKARSSGQQGVGHGGGTSGKRRCKCQPCRMKKNEYMRNWKRGVRAGAQAGLANQP